jgi:hypothetical protein
LALNTYTFEYQFSPICCYGSLYPWDYTPLSPNHSLETDDEIVMGVQRQIAIKNGELVEEEEEGDEDRGLMKRNMPLRLNDVQTS